MFSAVHRYALADKADHFMARCAKCITLAQSPKDDAAGAHLRSMEGRATRMRLDYAPAGRQRHDVTTFVIYSCPEQGCSSRWWRGVAKDGSFVEWRFAGEDR